MAPEEAFGVTLSTQAPKPVYKAVFTRQPFRLADLAELVYFQQGTGTPERSFLRAPKTQPSPAQAVPFTQLSGTWNDSPFEKRLFEPLTSDNPAPQFRWRSDGMRCVLIPAAAVENGRDGPDAEPDERPLHVVHLDAFLIDAEPVGPEVLADWVILDAHDDRNEHVLIVQAVAGWHPVSGAERRPMILVSWYGANASSLWANGRDWMDYRDDAMGCFLPTEAQWE